MIAERALAINALISAQGERSRFAVAGLILYDLVRFLFAFTGNQQSCGLVGPETLATSVVDGPETRPPEAMRNHYN